jgi:hypothetical protein
MTHQFDTSEYVTLDDLPRRYTDEEIERIKKDEYNQAIDDVIAAIEYTELIVRKNPTALRIQRRIKGLK